MNRDLHLHDPCPLAIRLFEIPGVNHLADIHTGPPRWEYDRQPLPSRVGVLMEIGDFTSAFGVGGETSHAQLQVNATHDDVRLVRLLASGVASQAAFAIDDVEIARLVIDEACVILLDVCQPDTGIAPSASSVADVLVVACEWVPGALQVTASRPASSAKSTPSPISTRVLDGLTSKWSVRLDGPPTVIVRMETAPTTGWVA